MKKIETIFWKCCIIIVSILTFSCEHEGISPEMKNPMDSYKLPDVLLKGVHLVDGILLFESQEIFDRVSISLERENEAWKNTINKFIQDQAKGIDIENPFEVNENFVLELFEESLSFKSLRARICRDEELWLKDSELDFSKDPDNHFIVGDELRAVINENHEIGIGSSMYKVYRNWEVVEIQELDFSLLEELRNSDLEEIRSRQIGYVFHNFSVFKGTAIECEVNHSDTEYNNYKTNYKSKCRLTITNGPFVHFVKGETTNYKMNSRGNWKKEKCDHEIAIGGMIYDTGCNNGTTFDNSGSDDNEKSFSVKSSFGGSVRAKNNEISSSHYIDGSFVEHIILNW